MSPNRKASLQVSRGVPKRELQASVLLRDPVLDRSILGTAHTTREGDLKEETAPNEIAKTLYREWAQPPVLLEAKYRVAKE